MSIKWVGKYLEKVNFEVLKKKQLKLLIGLICAGGFLIFISVQFSEKENTKIKLNSSSSKREKIQLMNLIKGAKAEDRWIQRSEEELSNLKKDILSQKEKERILNKRVEELEKKYSDEVNRNVLTKSEDVLKEMKKELERLKRNLASVSSYSGSSNPGSFGPSSSDLDSNYPGSSYSSSNYPNYSHSSAQNRTSTSTNHQAVETTGDISSRRISLVELGSSKTSKETNLNNFSTNEYLPAGSYVPAVVMSGVDASVGIKSQTNPRPVLFRIIDEAKNAWFKEHQKTDLKGCVVTGAAEGDLSSERVFINLVRMSCSKEEGRVIETEVKGYVVSQGKVGIRGRVISREGDFITKSFLAGMVGGLGGGASQYFTTPANATVGGLLTQRPEAGDVLGQGLGKGVGNASERLSKYLIDRAEQYQPVISIPSGLEVELVFHKGVYIDGRKK